MKRPKDWPLRLPSQLTDSETVKATGLHEHVCKHDCDSLDTAQYHPERSHYLDCPVWVLIFNKG